MDVKKEEYVSSDTTSDASIERSIEAAQNIKKINNTKNITRNIIFLTGVFLIIFIALLVIFIIWATSITAPSHVFSTFRVLSIGSNEANIYVAPSLATAVSRIMKTNDTQTLYTNIYHFNNNNSRKLSNLLQTQSHGRQLQSSSLEYTDKEYFIIVTTQSHENSTAVHHVFLELADQMVKGEGDLVKIFIDTLKDEASKHHTNVVHAMQMRVGTVTNNDNNMSTGAILDEVKKRHTGTDSEDTKSYPDVDPCSLNLCDVDGTCSTNGDVTSCRCANGDMVSPGVKCELSEDDVCKSDTHNCDITAQCVPTTDNFICRCLDGITPTINKSHLWICKDLCSEADACAPDAKCSMVGGVVTCVCSGGKTHALVDKVPTCMDVTSVVQNNTTEADAKSPVANNTTTTNTSTYCDYSVTIPRCHYWYLSQHAINCKSLCLQKNRECDTNIGYSSTFVYATTPPKVLTQTMTDAGALVTTLCSTTYYADSNDNLFSNSNPTMNENGKCIFNSGIYQYTGCDDFMNASTHRNICPCKLALSDTV
eukprot:GHVR01091098.1.p1 GENE.GHVR01091098.1~~GHVR01091098.1.p1  ORF type:complete len:537 (-),score=115.78 GHVR01091098.1:112-1722(-)